MNTMGQARYLSGDGYYNDGKLELNEDAVLGFNNAAEEAVVQAEAGKTVLENTMNACGGLIDFGSEQELLNAGLKRVKRIQNFQTEFNRYVTGVKEIEGELNTSLRNIMASDPDPWNQKWNRILQNLNTKGANLYTLQMLKSVKATTQASSYLDSIVSPNLQELIVVDEDGTYAFEALLQKEMSELTPEEIEMLQALYQELCTSIEQAGLDDACVLQTNMLEHFIENLYKIEPVYEYSYYGGKHLDGYKVVSKDELIIALSDTLFVTTDKVLSDSILRSIYGTEEAVSASVKEELVNVEFGFTDIGYTLSVSCLSQEGTMSGQTKEGLWEHYIINEVRASNYVDSLDIGTLRRMEELGYGKTELVNMYCQTQNTFDLKCLNNMFSGDYETLFRMEPSELSASGEILLAKYANSLLYTENGVEELTRFINVLLHTDPERCGNLGTNNVDEYLRILRESSEALIIGNSFLANITLSSDAGEEKFKELRDYGQTYYEMYGIWATLLEATQTQYFTNLDHNYYYGNYTYQISDMEKLANADGWSMKLGVYTQDGDMTYMHYKGNLGVEQKQDLKVKVSWGHLEASNDMALTELQKLYQEMDEEKAKALFTSAVSMLSLGSGEEIEKIVSTINNLAELYQGNYTEVGKETGGKIDEKLGLDNKLSAPLNVLFDYYDYSQIEEKYRIKIANAADAYIVSAFGSCVVGEIDGNKMIIDSGVYDPYILARLREWEENGIVGLVGVNINIGNTLKIVQDLDTEAGYQKFVREHTDTSGKEKVDIGKLEQCVRLLVCGSDTDGDGVPDAEKGILDYDAEILMKAFDVIGQVGPEGDSKYCLDYLYEEKP